MLSIYKICMVLLFLSGIWGELPLAFPALGCGGSRRRHERSTAAGATPLRLPAIEEGGVVHGQLSIDSRRECGHTGRPGHSEYGRRSTYAVRVHPADMPKG